MYFPLKFRRDADSLSVLITQLEIFFCF